MVKKIIVYLLSFLGLVLILSYLSAYGFEYLYQRMYIGQTGGEINNFLRREKVSILAMGDSRCAHHIVPAELGERGFNLSHNGMSLIFHAGLLDQLLRHEQVHIDTLLLHVEPKEWFNDGQKNAKDIQHLKYYYGKNAFISSQIDGLSATERFKYVFPLYRFNGRVINVLKNYLQTRFSVPTADGYVPFEVVESDSLRLATMPSPKPQIGALSAPDQLTMAHFNHIHALAKARGITLICFSSPVYFSPDASDTINARQSMLLAVLFREKGVPYFDYYHAKKVECLSSPGHWKDATHLNHSGATLLTRQLKKDLATARHLITLR